MCIGNQGNDTHFNTSHCWPPVVMLTSEYELQQKHWISSHGYFNNMIMISLYILPWGLPTFKISLGVPPRGFRVCTLRQVWLFFTIFPVVAVPAMLQCPGIRFVRIMAIPNSIWDTFTCTISPSIELQHYLSQCKIRFSMKLSWIAQLSDVLFLNFTGDEN